MKKAKFIMYDLDLICENGRCESVYTVKGKSYQNWPNTDFKRIASKLGYTRLVTDTTLVGGYYVNHDSGNCLVCLPVGIDPKNIYG